VQSGQSGKTTTNGHFTTFEFRYNYNTNWSSSSRYGTCNDDLRCDFNQYGTLNSFHVTNYNWAYTPTVAP